MDELEILKQQYRMEKARVEALRDKIEDIELAQRLPALRQQYEGKYFIFKEDDPDDSFVKYVHCKHLIDEHDGIFDAFWINNEHYVFTSNNKEEGCWYCQTEITKEEYITALKSFLEKANNLTHAKELD
jgi:hypothetical protein